MTFWKFRTRIGNVALAISLASAIPATISAMAADSAATESWRELAAEQARLIQEIGRLIKDDKPGAALPLTEKQIAISRRLIAAKPAGAEGKKAVETAGWYIECALQWLVGQDLGREQWAGAVRRQRELVDFELQQRGKDDDRTGGARRELAYLETLQKLPLHDARQLRKADELQDQATQLRKRDKDHEAIPPAEESLRIRKRLLNALDVRTARVSVLLGTLYQDEGDCARRSRFCGRRRRPSRRSWAKGISITAPA